MSFWIQHGYGKGTKVADLLGQQLATGVILSPGDEPRSTLLATAADSTALGAEILLDPQLYVHTLPTAQARCHEINGIDFGAIPWSVSPRTLQDHIDAVLDLNRQVGTTGVIAPAPMQSSFNDVWTPVALQYARGTLDQAESDVYVSVVVEESAFSDWDAIESWLDAVTALDARGFYVVVARSDSTYPGSWRTEQLAAVLRVIYRLSVLNDYRVIWGYSDIAGVLGLCAGAEGVASGWFYSLRTFSKGKWLPRSGGRQAVPRLFVESLLAPLEAESEAGRIATHDLGIAVFPDDEIRGEITNRSWGVADAWAQHLESLARLVEEVASIGHFQERLGTIRAALVESGSLLDQLSDAGIVLRPAYRSQIRAYAEALEIMIDEEGL